MLIHICNNFISSKVHSNLVKYISDISKVRQFIFVPIRTEEHRGIFDFSATDVDIVYRKCQGAVIRFFPLLKIIFTLLSLIYSLRGTDLRRAKVLAHTLWSDGCVAYLFSLLTGLRYSVVVRNTDVNWFIPKLPHYRWLIARIIAKADAVIFVSPAHRERFSQDFAHLYETAKIVKVIPNGVEEFWMQNINMVEYERPETITFVGRFDKNKNLDGLIAAAKLVRKDIKNLRLVLIGGTANDLATLIGSEEIPTWVECLGRIVDKAVIRDHYRNSRVFAAPSHTETFGLVYVEALTQGCPFIYTAGEGVDGFFNNAAYCKAVNSRNAPQIAAALLALLVQFRRGVSHELIKARISEFSWASIALQYVELMNVSSVNVNVDLDSRVFK